MSDVFTKAKRSDVMSRIRSRGNKDTELALMRVFRAHGITGLRRRNGCGEIRFAGLRGGELFSFCGARLPEFVQPASPEGTILELQCNLGGPAGTGTMHVIHDAHGARSAVNHDFAEITVAGCLALSFSHIDVSIRYPAQGFNL